MELETVHSLEYSTEDRSIAAMVVTHQPAVDSFYQSDKR